MKRSNKMKHKQVKTPVIPVGPRFRAEIPCWTGPPRSKYYRDFSSTKWLGIRVWPNKDIGSKTNVEAIGQGRPNYCSYPSPGSIECVERHVSERRSKLKSSLGAAFWGWKFNEIGEEVSKLWNLREHEQLDCIVKRSFRSEGNSFVKVALELFPTQTRETIVRCYFNVFVPRHMKIQTRYECELIDSDNDEDGPPSVSKVLGKGVELIVPQKSYKFCMNNYLSRRR